MAWFLSNYGEDVRSEYDCGTNDSKYYYYCPKKLLKKYPKYAEDNYVWNKKLKDYTSTDIKKLNLSKLNFIYNSNISFLKEVHQNIKDTRTYAIILLGYLFAVTLASIGFAFKDDNFEISQLELIALYVAGLCLILSAPVAYLFYDKYTTYVHFTSEEYMEEEMFKYDEKLLKIHEIRVTQLTGTLNYFIAKRMRRHLDVYITIALAIPIIIALLTFVLGDGQKWFCYLCQ